MSESTQVQNIVTKFRVAGGQQYAAAMGRIGSQSSVTGQSLARMSNMLGPLKIAIAGAMGGFTLAKVAQVGAEFEDTRRSIAGMFATFGMARDFNQGLSLAASTMRRIEIDSAKLPGEAEDYVATYRAALPGLQAALHGNNDEMVKFSNQFTALTSTMGVEGPLAAAGLSRMLSVGRGTIDDMSPAFRALLPYMTKATRGTRNMVTSVSQFNKLTQDQRFEILKTTMAQEGLQKMLEDAGNSWTAQYGTIQSIGKNIFRLGTAPLFEKMKEGLGKFNLMLMDSDGKLTNIGQTLVNVGKVISSGLGKGLSRMVGLLREGANNADRMMTALGNSPIVKALGGALANVERVVKARAGAAAGMKMGASIGGAPGAMIGAAFSGLIQDSRALDKVWAGLTSIGMSALKVLGPAVNAVLAFGEMVGDIAARILPSFVSGVATVLGPLMEFAIGMFNIATMIFDSVGPVLGKLFTAIGWLFESISKLLAPVFRLLGAIALGLASKLFDMDSKTAGLIDGIVAVIGWLNAFVSALAKIVGEGVDIILNRQPSAEGPAAESDAVRWIRETMEGFRAIAAGQDSAAAGTAAGTTPVVPPNRGGGKTTQDFRYSRFDISQKFAEGFDPDRIAVAFATDLGRIGEQRLQSGFEPAQAIR